MMHETKMLKIVYCLKVLENAQKQKKTQSSSDLLLYIDPAMHQNAIQSITNMDSSRFVLVCN